MIETIGNICVDIKVRAQEYYLDIIAVGGAVIGSACNALDMGLGVIVYSMFLLSSFASIVLLRRSDVSKSMIWLNYYFLSVNMLGMVIAVSKAVAR